MNLALIISFVFFFLINSLITIVIFYHFKKFKLKEDKLGDLILNIFLGGFFIFTVFSFFILLINIFYK